MTFVGEVTYASHVFEPGFVFSVPRPGTFLEFDQILVAISKRSVNSTDNSWFPDVVPAGFEIVEGFPEFVANEPPNSPIEFGGVVVYRRILGNTEPISYDFEWTGDVTNITCTSVHLVFPPLNTPLVYEVASGHVATNDEVPTPSIDALQNEIVVSIASIHSNFDPSADIVGISNLPWGTTSTYQPVGTDCFMMGVGYYQNSTEGPSEVGLWEYSTAAPVVPPWLNLTFTFNTPPDPPEPPEEIACEGILKRYLPTDIAWKLVKGSFIEKWFCGWDRVLAETFQLFQDRIWKENDPQLTNSLEELEEQEGLRPSIIRTIPERRNYLSYRISQPFSVGRDAIQEKLRAAGFFVSVHSPYYYFNSGATAVYNPGLYLLPEFGGSATDGRLIWGGYSERLDRFRQFQMGENQMGEIQMGDGELVIDPVDLKYTPEHETHPFYLYIGGATIDDVVDIDEALKDEFESLVLQAVKANIWIVLRVRYGGPPG